MTISVLQAACSDTAGSGPTCTQNITVAAGNTIQVFVSSTSAGGPIPTVADGTNTYLFVARVDSNNVNLEHWYAANVAGGTFTITATYASDANFRAMCLKEIGGTSGYDTHAEQAQAVSSTSADAITTGNSPALSAAASLISGLAFNNNGTVSASAGTGFTLDAAGMTLFQGVNLGKAESKRVTGSSAVAATWTQASDGVSYNVMMAVFKETSIVAAGLFFAPWMKAGVGRNPARIGRQFAFMGSQYVPPAPAYLDPLIFGGAL